MIALKPSDVTHKTHLLRTLTEIVDNPLLSSSLYFKGGTCAAMIGILDRFSIDLDFDVKAKSSEPDLRKEFHKIFNKLGFTVDQESKNALEFFLKYKNLPNQRNSLKIDALNFIVKTNEYQPVFLAEINRTVNCQNEKTIFANKLVAVKDRYDKKPQIVGRDIYDIHHFFSKNIKYKEDIITERTKMTALEYISYLGDFIDSKITQEIIDQDLNTLLPLKNFKKIRKHLKNEVLIYIENEIMLLKENKNII